MAESNNQEEHPGNNIARSLDDISLTLKSINEILFKMANPPLYIRGLDGDKDVTLKF